MSKRLRKKLNSLIETLEEANGIIVDMLHKGNYVECINLVVDCQKCAIDIGLCIERVVGEKGRTVVALEEYCELLYQMVNIIEVQEECIKVFEKVCAQIQTVREDLNREIPDRIEVVFFPYKASMWDSLESVYLAAKKDVNCEVYVVPIPYFERNGDGSLGEMYCEADKYPKGIEIINWEEYSFESRQPDIAFIHNAYDECNLVTSVHPRFYSKNIKKSIDKLVYIPYFVLDDNELENPDGVEAIKHFCFLPGIVNADKVFLQSEKVRKIYMSEYKRTIEKFGGCVSDEELDRKFAGTGSPKFEKILFAQNIKPDVPVEWSNIIETGEDVRKKVVLYNTSINALLKYDDQYLEKIKRVFAYFKGHHEEYALLWRPHPLIMSTIESMRPQLKEEYEKIVAQYKMDNFGIYDDTAELDRAVILSDAYYGDCSSIVSICNRIGIPALLQNISNMETNTCKNIVLKCSAMKGDYEENLLWIVTNYSANLLKIDLSTGEVLAIYPLPIDNMQFSDYNEMKIVNNIIYMVPYNAEKLLCFSTEKETFFSVDLPIMLEEKGKSQKFSKIFEKNGMLYFIGLNINVVIKYDLRTRKMKRIDGFSDQNGKFTKGGVLNGDELYIAHQEKNLIFKINIKDDTWQEIVISNKLSEGFKTITGAEKEIILTDKKGNVLIYNLDQRCTESESNSGKNEEVQEYKEIIFYKGKQFRFMRENSEIVVVDNRGNLRVLPYEYPQVGRQNADVLKFQKIKAVGDRILFQAYTTGDFFEINMDSEMIRKLDINISDFTREKLLSAGFEMEVIRENDVYTLERYCQHIRKRKTKKEESTSEKCGERIYKIMISEI